jgi:divalent metal cation (Fe/Co/Zn/Cd) transporter
LTWTALTVIAMASLARAKTDTGIALANPVLVSEGRVTFVDAVLAAAVFVGVALNTTLHWWWADPIAGFVLVVYATKECMNIFRTRENSA